MLSAARQSHFGFVCFFAFFLFTSTDDVTAKLWRATQFFGRRRRRREPGVTSEEYSILLIQPEPGNSKISNQSGKIPQACSYTVAMPQRQPENASPNLKA